MPAFTGRQRAFLAQPLQAVVATLRQDGTAVQSVVWYVPDGDTLWISVRPESVKARHLQRDPRVAALILSPDGSGYLRVEGTAARDGEVDATARRILVGRYVGADRAEAWMADHPLPSPNARIRIRPTHIAEHNLG